MNGSEDLTMALPTQPQQTVEPKVVQLLREIYPDNALFQQQLDSMVKRGIVSLDVTSFIQRQTSTGLSDIDAELDKYLSQGPDELANYVERTVPRRIAARKLLTLLVANRPIPAVDDRYDWLLVK